eukprot:9377-Eustigmatos_ZCMA.PRE.1
MLTFTIRGSPPFLPSSELSTPSTTYNSSEFVPILASRVYGKNLFMVTHAYTRDGVSYFTFIRPSDV